MKTNENTQTGIGTETLPQPRVNLGKGRGKRGNRTPAVGDNGGESGAIEAAPSKAVGPLAEWDQTLALASAHYAALDVERLVDGNRSLFETDGLTVAERLARATGAKWRLIRHGEGWKADADSLTAEEALRADFQAAVRQAGGVMVQSGGSTLANAAVVRRKGVKFDSGGSTLVVRETVAGDRTTTVEERIAEAIEAKAQWQRNEARWSAQLAARK